MPLSHFTPSDCYYTDTAHGWTKHQALFGDLEADVCVIGGGIAGCASALHLAERGYRVVLLEAKQVGWGASGRSGGQIIPGFACDQAALAAQLGAGLARQLWTLSLEGISELRERISQHHIECDFQPGHLQVAIKKRQRYELQALQEQLEKHYHYNSLRLLDATEVQQQLATRRYCAGLLDLNAGHLHPLNYTRGLAAAAQDMGVQIYEHSEATAIEHGERLTIRTAYATVYARFAVLCGNAYLQHLAPTLQPRIMPVGTYMIATEPLGDQRAAQLIRNNYAVADSNFVLDYFRCTADHRLLFGGRISYSGKTLGDITASSRQHMLTVFPQLADVQIDYSWGGYIDITRNRAPDFGRLANNVYYLQGFSGHGLALAGLAGKLVAEAIAQQAERFDIFTRIKHKNFPGGPLLRTPILMLAMLWYRLQDLL